MWVATGTGLLSLPTSLVQQREVGHFFLQWKHPILDGRKNCLQVHWILVMMKTILNSVFIPFVLRNRRH